MSVAKKLSESPTSAIEPGVVLPSQPGTDALRVRLDSGEYRARRAKSCLVAPDVGDKVLCAVDAEQVYVLAILEGSEPRTTIAADGDLELVARGGRATLTGTEGVDVVTAADVSVTSAEVNVRSERGTVAVDDLGFFGKLVQAEVKKIVVVASEVDSILGRLTQKAKRAYRFIEELDQTRAGMIDTRAETMLGIRAENAIISARILTKVDGEQVHIG